MKDSAKLLNFNVNRELKFTVFRSINFDTRRNLSFDTYRELGFSTNRDLGFGKRGVVFRGYVCPVCRAPVAKNAPQCDECGVKFEQPAKPQKQVPRKNEWDRKKGNQEPDALPNKPPKTIPQRRSTFECPGCSKILYVGAERCPGCSTQFVSSSSVPSPSKAKATNSGVAVCSNCNFSIPPSDRFCRRCGSQRPAGNNTMVSWDEYATREKAEGVISWDEYSKRKGGG